MPPKIEQWEITKYWDIFSTLIPPGGTHLSGAQAASILKNSQLSDNQLERVWDLADVDNDGSLDFEEFCVAMRIIYDLVNGNYADVPAQLPDWLVPESKAHLVQAGRALKTGYTRSEGMDDDDLDDGVSGGLKDGFDWYMPPAQKAQYEEIYDSVRDAHGYVSFPALGDLYSSLDVPDTDVRSAWNLVNPAADEVIGKDAALAFLHVLRGRHDGLRLPRTVPPSLRASFERRDVDYNVERARAQALRQRADADSRTATGRKGQFGDAYLSRLGAGGAGATKPRGTDFSRTKTTEDWEEVRLKKQLRELEEKIASVEEAQRQRDLKKGGAGMRDSKPALIKRELEQMLDYKRRELRDLETGEGKSKASKNLRSVAEEISTVREQVEGLEAHLKRRNEVLEDLRNQIREEKAR